MLSLGDTAEDDSASLRPEQHPRDAQLTSPSSASSSRTFRRNSRRCRQRLDCDTRSCSSPSSWLYSPSADSMLLLGWASIGASAPGELPAAPAAPGWAGASGRGSSLAAWAARSGGSGWATTQHAWLA